MPVNNNAREKQIAAQNAQLQLKKTNPEKFKLLQEKAALNSMREKELLREEEHKSLITRWEGVRATEISTGAFLANFRIGSVLNEQSLIATLFQEVEVVTDHMLELLCIIFYNGNAYISSGDVDDKTKVLDQYKDCKVYTVMFEGLSQEIGSIYPFRGKVVFGKRIGEEVNFSDTYVPHLVLPGCVMKKLIEAGFVTPVFYC